MDFLVDDDIVMGPAMPVRATATYDPTCDYDGACCHYDAAPRCRAERITMDPINGWIAQVVQDMASFEDHELVIHHVCPYHAAMAYVLRCLANPQCAGSGDVLDAIVAKRAERMAQ